MAYELHIERNPSITVEEWRKAVETTEGVEIDESDFVTINPATGNEIRIPGSPETAALWISNSGEWIKVFRFRNERISFAAKDWDTPQSLVRGKAFELAQKLNAEITGDEGEIYTN